MDYLSVLKDTMDYLYKKYNLAQIWFTDVECILFDGKNLVLSTNSDIRRSFLKGYAGQHLKVALKELHQIDATIVVLDDKPIIDTRRIKKRLSTAKIIHAVCECFNITEETLFDPDAKAPANLALRTAMFFLDQCKYTLSDIAQLFSRDESTIDYGIYSISCGIKAEDPDILEIVNKVKNTLEQLSAEEIP